MSAAGQKRLALRKATEADAEMLFAWRNDPETRANSFHQDELVWEDHLAYLKRVLHDEHVALFIGENDEGALGTVRSVWQEGTYTLSWAVAPAHRGRGWGKRLLAGLIATLPAGAVYRAEVLAHNAASHRLAQAVGMQVEQVVDEITYYKGVRSEQ